MLIVLILLYIFQVIRFPFTINSVYINGVQTIVTHLGEGQTFLEAANRFLRGKGTVTAIAPH
jgi:hypothetical protein